MQNAGSSLKNSKEKGVQVKQSKFNIKTYRSSSEGCWCADIFYEGWLVKTFFGSHKENVLSAADKWINS